MKAIWNGQVIAECDETVVVENNHYFPAASVNSEFLKASSAQTNCPWKGIASYYDLVVDGAANQQAAWYYADPKPEAAEIKDHVAFWKGVEVSP